MVEMQLYNHQLKKEAIKAIELNKFKEYAVCYIRVCPIEEHKTKSSDK